MLQDRGPPVLQIPAVFLRKSEGCRELASQFRVVPVPRYLGLGEGVDVRSGGTEAI
jgi:hypothetical protein